MASEIILSTSKSRSLSVAAEKLSNTATRDVEENFAADFECEESKVDFTSGFRGGKGDENLEVGNSPQTPLPLFFPICIGDDLAATGI